MSANNPIRVAEETAILDHLTKGRFFVGFARGYQSRWVNVLAQHLGSRATRSPSTATKADIAITDAAKRSTQLEEDKANRDVFEQQLDMVIRAWTEESIESKDRPWQIPYPYDKGINDWPLALEGVTERLGAHGEVDANRTVRRISVVPAPYTKPHPPVFVMSLGSPESIAYCGRKGFVPVYVAGLRTAVRGGEAFEGAAKAAGRSYAGASIRACCDIPDSARRWRTRAVLCWSTMPKSLRTSMRPSGRPPCRGRPTRWIMC